MAAPTLTSLASALNFRAIAAFVNENETALTPPSSPFHFGKSMPPRSNVRAFQTRPK
jgi:hypothetical protein